MKDNFRPSFTTERAHNSRGKGASRKPTGIEGLPGGVGGRGRDEEEKTFFCCVSASEAGGAAPASTATATSPLSTESALREEGALLWLSRLSGRLANLMLSVAVAVRALAKNGDLECPP